MKTISYDHENYTVIDTIEFDDELFQKVQFPDGNYGIVYVLPEDNVYDVILVGTDTDDTYVNVFMALARANTEILNKIHENIEEVKLVIMLNDKQSEIFEETVSTGQANDLIERLKITNEIIALERQGRFDFNRTNFILCILLIILCIINFLSILHNTGVI